MVLIFILLLEALLFTESYAPKADIKVDAVVTKFSDPSIIGMLLEKFLDLGIKALKEARNGSESMTLLKGGLRTCDEASVEAVIGAKVKLLRNVLHDANSEQDDKLTLKGNDETTVEIVMDDAKDTKGNPVKEKVQKYKMLRKKIHKALIDESVSDQTIELTVRTLDEMIAGMLSSRCSWKSSKDPTAMNDVGIFEKAFTRMGKEFTKMENGLAKMENSFDNISKIPDAWRLEWNKMKEKYSELFTGQEENPKSSSVRSLMEKLPSFFSSILRDGELLARRSMIKCEKINSEGDINSSNIGTYVKTGDISRRNNICVRRISICSTELKRHLMNVYKSINATTEKVLNDYVAMYRVDVYMSRKASNKEVLDRLEVVAQRGKDQVCGAVVQKYRQLSLEKNDNPNIYIKAISKFTKDIMDQVELRIRDTIMQEMIGVNGRLRDRVIGDINTNMGLEFRRLVRELNKKACETFETCNRRYTVKGRRRKIGRKGVFVKVQMTFDDELQNITQTSRRYNYNSTVYKPNLSEALINGFKSKISVTRTTRLK